MKKEHKLGAYMVGIMRDALRNDPTVARMLGAFLEGKGEVPDDRWRLVLRDVALEWMPPGWTELDEYKDQQDPAE